ncbi:pre-mRNA 3' end processing protein WDR33-like isoform X1 [Saccostrea echinata]|uniref:pre-mRNA 3' end processing protein WDR33-like isoform X1 n=1 Tax=Saccostrea echinata TaxID=191078 RepID=UPI002A809DE0|nr:pre-mRNA 3' end processing protein WDR33-like isoform X1 [Saccostrea echinata]XP_061163199.1 pre-mRNA 3' end processing protein WDR33-like isoform X1 [Saccostrea echinata]
MGDSGGVVTIPMQPMPTPGFQAFQRPNARTFQRRGPQLDPKGGAQDGDNSAGPVMFDGKRMRKAVHRKTVDYNSAVVQYLENRVWQRDYRDMRAIQADSLYQIDIPPPIAMINNSMNCVTTKFIRASTNKFRCPIFCLAWTPEGRRLVTGASSGEFTLWNGLTFNFETILQAHDTSCRAMQWSHNDNWMVTADHFGYIKYWQSNMNNVKMYQGHKEPIRGLSFCPSDSKFATCSDDGTVRIWDFMKCHEEKILRGHGSDVKCVDWHPQKALLASGSKDNQQPIKLWDPRAGTSLATIHAHKATVMELKWNKNGNWLLTASRDHLLKVFDIRNMKEEIQTFKGHKKEATAVAWHPIHEGLFVSGGSDGAVMFWNMGLDREVGSMEEAHEGMVWSLAWHPMGHILATGSNDHSTKFWTRNRPGDRMRDRYNLNTLPGGSEHELAEFDPDATAGPLIPGMGQIPSGQMLVSKEEEKAEEEDLPSIPGLDWSADESFFKQQEQPRMPIKKIPYAKPIPWDFERAWMTNKLPNVEKEDPKRRRDKDWDKDNNNRKDRRNRGRDRRNNDEDWQDEEYDDEQMNPDSNHDNMLNPGQRPMGGMMGNMPPGDPNQGRGPFNQGPGDMNQGRGPFNQGPGDLSQGRGPFNQGPMQPRDGMGNSGPPGNMNMPPDNMGPGGMMQGNMGPGVRNMNPGNFGNRNPGNFGGMNNMPFQNPDQRKMGPNQGPGPMNNPPRFQGNQGGQFGQDSFQGMNNMQGNSWRQNRNQSDNFSGQDSFQGDNDYRTDVDFRQDNKNQQGFRGGRGGRFQNRGDQDERWNDGSGGQQWRNDLNMQENWGSDGGNFNDQNFGGNMGGGGGRGGRGRGGGGGWNERRGGGSRGNRNDGNFNQSDQFNRKRNWNQGPGDSDFNSGPRNSGFKGGSGPQGGWSEDHNSGGRGRGRGNRGNRGFRGGRRGMS